MGKAKVGDIFSTSTEEIHERYIKLLGLPTKKLPHCVRPPMQILVNTHPVHSEMGLGGL